MVFAKNATEKSRNWVYLAGTRVENQDQVVLLGEILQNDIFRGKANYAKTVKSARAAGRRVNWMCGTEKGSLISLMRAMNISTVVSRIRGGLALTTLDDEQYDQLDSVVATVVKETMAVSYMVSARAILAMVGLRSMRTELEHEKLRLYGRAMAKTAGPLVHQIVRMRKDQIDSGEEDQGF
jgi:hypothetical protein